MLQRRRGSATWFITRGLALMAVALAFPVRLAEAQTAPPPPPETAPLPPPPPPPPPPAPSVSGGGLGVSLVAPSYAPRVIPAPPPAEEREDAKVADNHPLAFRAEFKLPFAIDTLLSSNGETQSPFASVPQLVLGFQTGRFGLGAGIGFSRLGVSTSENAVGGLTVNSAGGSITELLLAPTVTVDAFQSEDGKVALYFLGAPIFGVILESNEGATSDLGFQFAIGANVALHKNFHIGLEVGPVGHFYNSGGETLSDINIYTALVGSFVTPR